MDKAGTTEGLKSFSKPGLSKVVCQKLTDNALRQTEFFDISHSSKLLPNFNKQSAVHPQLENVEFYKHSSGNILDYIPQTSSVHHQRMEEHELGYRRAATLKDILENFKEGQICFTGQAGSGKTTLLRSITRDIIGRKYENFNDDQVVHFVSMRSFKNDHSVTPAELLFRNVVPEMSESEMKEAMHYAKENPDKVLFVIDSLDTIPYTIDGVYTGVRLGDRASPEAILYHLLAGELIPGGRFITSSREFAVRNYKGTLQANQVIALAGLTNESMRKIVVGYLGEKEADEIMTFLKSKPVIESLCSTPLWLIFTLMALKSKSTFKPSTMAGILVMVIQSMIRSEHVHQKDIESIFDKLTEMAFTGTAQRRVEFSEGELSDYDLDLGDIVDLMIVTPSGAFQRLIFGDSTLIYAHQCLQEVLTAFRIAIMEYEKFKAFIIENINKPYFAMIRRLLTGILMNEEVFEEAENFLENGGDFEEKKRFLKEILKEQIQSRLSNEDQLELYICLSEGGDALRDIARDNVREFKFSFMSLSPSEMYSIGWVMSQQTSVNELDLRKCNLSSALLSVLYQELEGSNVKLKKFYVGDNDLGPEEMMLIAKISKQCKVHKLDFRCCKLKSEALRSFLDSSVGLKLEELNVNDNDLGPEEMTLVAKISKQCNVDGMGIGCRFESEALESFLVASVGLKISTLYIGLISLMDDAARTILGLIIKQRGVETLVIYEPQDLEEIDVEAFKFSSFDHYKLGKVMQSKWAGEENLPGEALAKICQFFPHVATEVDLWNISPAGEEILQNQLDEGNNKDLKIICRIKTPDSGLKTTTLISKKSAENYCTPTIVKNRRAELNNGVIFVLWQYPKEDADVEYCVETFGDDQPTGEIMRCKQPRCEIKALLPSTAYCFKIWAVDLNGISGQAMFTNEVVNCPLPVRNLNVVFVRDEISEASCESSVIGKEITDEPISKSFSEEITPEGGKITVGGCSIQFRPRTFSMTTKVSGKVEIGQRKWPANYTGITALFYIYTVNNLSMPAIVRMKSWCAPGLSKEGKAMKAHVLHFREDIKFWEVLEELPLNDEYVFQFECKKFSPIQVAIRDDQRGQERLLIESTIFTSCNTFSVISHLRDDLLGPQLEDRMKTLGFYPKMDFSPIIVMLNDNVRVLLSCVAPEGFSFPLNKPLHYTVDEYFLRKKFCLMNAVLIKHTNEPLRERLVMKTHIEKEDMGLLDGPHSFYYEWQVLALDDRESPIISRKHKVASSEPPGKRTKIAIIPTEQYLEQPTTSRHVSNVGGRIPEDVQHGNVLSQRSEGSVATSHVSLLQHEQRIQYHQQQQPSPPQAQTMMTENTQTVRKIHPKRRFKQPDNQQLSPIGGATVTGSQLAFVQHEHNFPSASTSFSTEHMPSQTRFQVSAHEREAMQHAPGLTLLDFSGFASQQHQGQNQRQHYPGESQHHTVPKETAEGPLDLRSGVTVHQSSSIGEGTAELPLDLRLGPEASLDPRLAQIPGECHISPELDVQPLDIQSEAHSLQIGHSGSRHQVFGDPRYPQTHGEIPHPVTQTIPKAIMDVPRSIRTPQTPPELPEPALVMEGSRIRASWDAPEDTHRLTYYVNVYCNDQLCGNMPLKTRNTSVEYPIQPSCRYSCEVWAVNSRRVEGPISWTNFVQTPGTQASATFRNEEGREATQLHTLLSASAGSTLTFQHSQIYIGGVSHQQQPGPSVSAAPSTTISRTPSGASQQQQGPSVSAAPSTTSASAPIGTPHQEPPDPGASAAAMTSSSTRGEVGGGQRAFLDPTSAVTNVQVTRSTGAAYAAHFGDNGIYTIDQHRRKGRVLIINNEFRQTRSWREGSEVDVRNMVELWRKMGFDVETKLDLTAQQMLYFCRQFAQQTRDVSVVVVIVMSHGGKAIDGKEYFVGDDHRRAYVDDIVFFFTSNQSRHLRGIPKLFLFQACRGREIDVVADAETEVQQLGPPPAGPYFQERSDMLITFPTQYGNKALRHTAAGSLHMNAISHVFMRHAHSKHVLDMLTMVNNEVAKIITMDRRIQISNQSNYFRKNLFLFPGWPN